MRVIGLWMGSVDQDHTFPGLNSDQVDIRLVYMTVVSKVHCVRSSHYVATQGGMDISTIILFQYNISNKVF